MATGSEPTQSVDTDGVTNDQWRTTNGASVQEELDTKGYSVVPHVMTHADCDRQIAQYMQWLHTFGESWPHSHRSLIFGYKVSHSAPTWSARLAARPVFEHIWGTSKLLTSMDAISISPPPESGRLVDGDCYRRETDQWLHVDQAQRRLGLHAYQGALYLEETTREDYCFRVLEGSHKFHKEFFEMGYQEDALLSFDYCRPGDAGIKWYERKGCEQRLVPVPKGAMVIWDSRVVHDSVKPCSDRQHENRWRFVVFVCMAPAIWADEDNLETKQQAFSDHLPTSHWPCQGVNVFEGENSATDPKRAMSVDLGSLLDKDESIRQLAGVLPYDFQDGTSNGPGWKPRWKGGVQF